MTINYDICNFTRVVVSSTNQYFGENCDIFIYHRFSEVSFSVDCLNIFQVFKSSNKWRYSIVNRCINSPFDSVKLSYRSGYLMRATHTLLIMSSLLRLHTMNRKYPSWHTRRIVNIHYCQDRKRLSFYFSKILLIVILLDS